MGWRDIGKPRPPPRFHSRCCGARIGHRKVRIVGSVRVRFHGRRFDRFVYEVQCGRCGALFQTRNTAAAFLPDAALPEIP